MISHPTFPRPLHPYVARNPFREQRYQISEIMPFSTARDLLPVPILPEHPRWVEMYWRAWELAWQHLRQPKSSSGFISNFIDTAFNDNTFMWDSAFMTLFGIYGRRAFDFAGTLDNFYAKQHDDGFICREINTYEGYDYFYPFDPNGTGPNILAWAEWRLYRHTKDDARLKQVFWPLLAFHEWFRAHRTWPSQLYWATGLSSGMDNQRTFPHSDLYHGHWTWVDATMQGSLNCRVLAQMAHVLGETELADTLNEERAFLHRDINARLWNESTQFYHDRDAGGEHSTQKSIGAYWGLLDKDLVPEERIVPFLRHLRAVECFNRPHRVPSLSADSDGYDAINGHYWRGGVWAPTNYMVLKGVRRVRHFQLAHDIAVNHLENVSDVFQHSDTFWENYAPEQPAPSEPSKPDFVGWTGLSPIAILIEDVIGLSIDWPLRRVTWDRRLSGEEAYGVRSLPLGRDGHVDISGNRATVEVTSTVPFSLAVRDQDAVFQAAIAAGHTTISLV